MRALGARGPTQTALPDTAILLFPAKQTAQKKRTGHFSPFSSPASLSLSLSISEQVVRSQLAMTRLHPPTRFCGTSTLVFSTTAESSLLPLLLPEMGARVVFFVHLVCRRCRTGLSFASAATIRPKIQPEQRDSVITGQLVPIPRMNQRNSIKPLLLLFLHTGATGGKPSVSATTEPTMKRTCRNNSGNSDVEDKY